jgi:hypothetical protein
MSTKNFFPKKNVIVSNFIHQSTLTLSSSASHDSRRDDKTPSTTRDAKNPLYRPRPFILLAHVSRHRHRPATAFLLPHCKSLSSFIQTLLFVVWYSNCNPITSVAITSSWNSIVLLFVVQIVNAFDLFCNYFHHDPSYLLFHVILLIFVICLYCVRVQNSWPVPWNWIAIWTVSTLPCSFVVPLRLQSVCGC